MRRLGLVVLLSLLATACQKGGGVAVVDLESVARSLGRDQTMEQQINTRTQELQGQLQQVAKQINDKLQAEMAKTPDQRPQLQQQAQAAFVQQQQQAQQLLNTYRVKLATDFRNEVKAASQKVAEERGLSMVIAQQVAIYAQDGTDITDEVTKAMRGGAAAPAAGAAPASGAKPAG